jgi:hypothetical protein
MTLQLGFNWQRNLGLNWCRQLCVCQRSHKVGIEGSCVRVGSAMPLQLPPARS